MPSKKPSTQVEPIGISNSGCHDEQSDRADHQNDMQRPATNELSSSNPTSVDVLWPVSQVDNAEDAYM